MSEKKNHESYDLPALLEAQGKFFRNGRTRSVEARVEALDRLRMELESRTDDLLGALAKDLGKPGVEAYASEIYFSISEIRCFTKYLKHWARPQRVASPFYFWPARSEIRFEPFGNTLIVAPWNYPVQLSLGPLIAAVAAGNTVVLKPSEHAPATAGLLAEILGKVFDPRQVAVIQGGPEMGQQLLEQPFDFWFYTGNEKIGRLYAKAAAENLAPVVLELGGKCPCIVDDDVDLEKTVERILNTKFFNAGQTCIAPDFVLVPETLHDSFVEKAREILTAHYGNNLSADLASIIHSDHFERLQKMIPEGAIRIGEDNPEENFLAPTLIPRARWDSPAMREEIFGPLLPILSYTSLEQTLDQVGSMPSPLALYAFSRDKQFLEKIAGSIRSGSVCFNDALKQATNLNLPFGGVRESGMGRYRGRFGFETFSYQRAVTRRWFCKDPFQVSPPYEGALERLRKILK